MNRQLIAPIFLTLCLCGIVTVYFLRFQDKGRANDNGVSELENKSLRSSEISQQKKAKDEPELDLDTNSVSSQDSLDLLLSRWHELEDALLNKDQIRAARCQIIEALVQRGSYVEALALAETETDRFLRGAYFQSLFTKQPSLQQALETLRGANFSKKDISSAWAGIIYSLRGEGGFQKVERLLLGNDELESWEISKLFSGAFGSMGPGILNTAPYVVENERAAYPTENEKKKIFESYIADLEKLSASHPELAASGFKQLMRSASFVLPEESLNLFFANSEMASNASAVSTAEYAIENLFRKAPAKGIHQLSRLYLVSPDSSAAKEVAKIWIKTDPKRLVSWLEEPKEEVESRMFDDLAIVAVSQLRESDLDKASEILSLIKDEETQEIGREKIQQTQVALYLDEVGGDFGGSLNTLTSDSRADLGPYIQATFKEWNSSDPVAAEEWYEDRWSSLPMNQAQHIAAAYAEASVELRDFKAAEKWLEFIQDPKIKQKIMRSLPESP